MALYRRVLTRCTPPQPPIKFHIPALISSLTPKSTPSGPTSKNFPPAARRGRLWHCPCGAPAACRQPPKACAAVQHTQCFGPGRWAHIFSSLRRRAGLGKESFFQLSTQQKHKKALACGALLVLSIARAGDRPATCSRARRPLAEIGTKRSSSRAQGARRRARRHLRR